MLRGKSALAGSLLLTVLGCGGHGGPTAATSTDLAGTWRSDQQKYSGAGESVSVLFEFKVNATSTEVTSLRMINVGGSSHVLLVGPADDGWLPEGVARSVPISGGSFEVSRSSGDFECNGSKGWSYSFKGWFRSSTNADGEWKDKNYGPAGYTFCGSESFDWKASKQ